MTATGKKFRIWAQGATDKTGHQSYLAQLLPYMQACVDPDFEIEFHTTNHRSRPYMHSPSFAFRARSSAGRFGPRAKATTCSS